MSDSKGINGIALGSIVLGGLFVYSGVKGYSILVAAQNIIQGKPGSANQTTSLLSTAPSTSSGDAAAEGGGGPLGQGGTPSQNQAIAKKIAASYGWDTGAEWDALVSLWESESSWSNTIWNTTASCGGDAFAYGIVQACGHGSHQAIPGHGSVCPYPPGNAGNPPQCGGKSDAGAQIAWGLAYIKANYGSPVNVPHGGY